MLFHELSKVESIDASVSGSLWEANFLEHVSDPALLRGHYMLGA